MKPWPGFFLLTFLLSCASGAVGAETLRWRCWYDRQVHILCLLVAEAPAGNLPMESLPPGLPESVKLLRSHPEAFRGRLVHIPLHTYSLDEAFAAQLATMTVCGSRRDCAVDYSQTPPPAAEIAPLLREAFPGPAAVPGAER